MRFLEFSKFSKMNIQTLSSSWWRVEWAPETVHPIKSWKKGHPSGHWSPRRRTFLPGPLSIPSAYSTPPSPAIVWADQKGLLYIYINRTVWEIVSPLVSSRAFEWAYAKLCKTILNFRQLWRGPLVFQSAGTNLQVAAQFGQEFIMVWKNVITSYQS